MLNRKLANQKAMWKTRKRTWTLDGEPSRNDKASNQNSDICICRRSRDKLRRWSNIYINRLVGAITTCEHSHTEIISRKHSIIMNKSFQKIQKSFERHPSITSSDENEVDELVGDGNLNAITTETNSTKINTILSIPSQLHVETFPAVEPAHIIMSIMSIVGRNCKTVSKATALPDLFNLRFVESQYVSDPQLEAIYYLIKSKNPYTASKSKQ